jgi:glycosyltransferase involved in cell wall biosynthesis
VPAQKIVIVADWLTVMAGAERVVIAMHEAFPDAPIYTSVYEPEPALREALKGADIRTTWIQKLPHFIRRFYKWFPVIRVWAFRSLDLNAYDIILTSTIAESKHVRKTRTDQLLICYCHTPVRYYWSHYEQYKKDPGFGKFNWVIRLLIPLFMPRQKVLDFRAAQKIDVFLANSTEVQERIKKYYKRSSTVLYPPVDTNRFEPARVRGDYYVALGRQVPYKRIDLAVAAATKLGVPLHVYGNGSEHQKLMTMAGANVIFYTNRETSASDEAVAEALNHAKGYIFPTEEDFGIVQAEALAAGTPVIAYGKGGALDIVQDGESGVLFDKQTITSVMDAIKRAESLTFLPGTLRRKAKRFDKGLFITKIRKIVADQSVSNSRI